MMEAMASGKLRMMAVVPLFLRRMTATLAVALACACSGPKESMRPVDRTDARV